MRADTSAKYACEIREHWSGQLEVVAISHICAAQKAVRRFVGVEGAGRSWDVDVFCPYLGKRVVRVTPRLQWDLDATEYDEEGRWLT